VTMHHLQSQPPSLAGALPARGGLVRGRCGHASH